MLISIIERRFFFIGLQMLQLVNFVVMYLAMVLSWRVLIGHITFFYFFWISWYEIESFFFFFCISWYKIECLK